VINRHSNWRWELSRELSRQSRLDVHEIVAQSLPVAGAAQRIGITGPPGAGKSSLIAAVAQRRLHCGHDVGVIAVDPTSPISAGSLLGDRIRMDAITDDDRLFIRSVPSGSCQDGLCPNIVGLLGTMEAFGFDDIVLETVGVGQVSYEARKHVDSLVLVLVPESGDTVQAMKAGILEVADVYVVNKADRPAADRMVAELRSVLHRRVAGDWEPPVILASAHDGRGVAEIDEAIDAHRKATLNIQRKAVLEVERKRYHMRALLQQRFDELFELARLNWGEIDIAIAFEDIARQMPLNKLKRS
jgi:LAO/AO transport system kinase